MSRKRKGIKYNGPDGMVLVNDKPLPRGAIVTHPPDVVAELSTRGDCEIVWEDDPPVALVAEIVAVPPRSTRK